MELPRLRLVFRDEVKGVNVRSSGAKGACGLETTPNGCKNPFSAGVFLIVSVLRPGVNTPPAAKPSPPVYFRRLPVNHLKTTVQPSSHLFCCSRAGKGSQVIDAAGCADQGFQDNSRFTLRYQSGYDAPGLVRVENAFQRLEELLLRATLNSLVVVGNADRVHVNVVTGGK